MTLPPRVWRAARVATLIVVTAIVAASLRAVDWQQTIVALRGARPQWLVVAVVANALILVCWTFYWRALRPLNETPVSFPRMFEVVAVSSALMNTLPFGGGHASTIVLLIRRASTTQRGALSTLALDQLGEGIAKVALLLLVDIVVPLPTWMRASLATVAFVVIAWFITLAVASRWATELEVLRSWRRALVALACVSAMKASELLAIMSVQHAYGLQVTIGGSLLVLGTVVLATMLPMSPGNLGAYEASVFLAYRYLGVSPEIALSLAIVQHVCFMLPAVGVGYLLLSAQAVARNAIASR